MTAAPVRTHFNITGFGEFAGVTNNPTQQLVQSLPSFLSSSPLPPGVCVCSDGLAVLEVSADGVRRALPALNHCRCAPAADDQQQQAQAQAQAQAEGADAAREQCVWLHFGVHAGSSEFALESTAYNEATFRVADQAGYQPTGAPILPQCPPSLCTTLDLEDMCRRLAQERGWKVRVSTDPGRFVCNYIFFHSLDRARQQSNCHALFVHVPAHNVYDLAAQQRFARDVLVEIARQLQQQRAGPDAQCSANTSMHTSAASSSPTNADA